LNEKEQEILHKTISRWILSSEEDFKTMQVLLMNNRYVHCFDFFFSALEKLLLALFLNMYGELPPLPCKLSLLLKKINPTLNQRHERYLAKLQKKFFDHDSITKKELNHLIQESTELKNWIVSQLNPIQH